MKTFVCAVVATMCVVGFVMAEDFTGTVTKIDGDKITGTKTIKGKKGEKGKTEDYTGKLAADAKVFKSKFDATAKGLVADGDDLKIAGLKAALATAENGSITVDGKALGDKDMLSLCIKDGKACAKLNDKDVDIATVKVAGKTPLNVRFTTADSGDITTILLIGGGKGGGKGFGGGN